LLAGPSTPAPLFIACRAERRRGADHPRAAPPAARPSARRGAIISPPRAAARAGHLGAAML